MALSKKEQSVLDRLTAKANDPNADDTKYHVIQVTGTDKLKSLLGLDLDTDEDADDDDDSDDDGDDKKKEDPQPKSRNKYFGR